MLDYVEAGRGSEVRTLFLSLGVVEMDGGGRG